MAWNEPGGNNQDPWGGRKKNDGPPDLDEALKKFQSKVQDIFGKKGGKGSGDGDGGDSSAGGPKFSGPIAGLVAVIVVVVYLAAGFYQLDAKEEAVILRFGKFHSIVGSGLKWNPKFIDTVYIINTTEERDYVTKAFMITKDISIVELPVTIQYNVGDVKSFVLNVRSPENSLKHATESAMRHVVGSTVLDSVLSEGRELIAVEVQKKLQEYLDSYGTGINVVNVNVQQGNPPAEVQASFDDVVKAKEDRERLINEAERYANAVVPEAEGRAARIVETATGYREKVISKAEGESERFNRLYAEYQKSPLVTRERLYIDAIESVMGNSSKVLVDVEGGNNMLFLPLDKIVNNANASGSASDDQMSPDILRRINESVTQEVRRTQSNANNSSRGLR
jgi:membrane protease subunit HflK